MYGWEGAGFAFPTCQNGEDVAGLVASLRGPLDCGATAHTLGNSSCRAAGGEETACPCRPGHDSEQQRLVPSSAKELCEHQDGLGIKMGW